MTPAKLKSYTKDNLDDLLALIQPVLEHRSYLYRRYSRKTNENARMGTAFADGKEKAIVAFEYYITNMAQGYLSGKAPMYSIRKGDHDDSYVRDYKTAVESIRRYNDDAATYVEAIHDYLITAAAYLYIFEDADNEIRYVRFDSRQTVAVFDYSTPPNLIGCVRCWKDGGDDVVEIITDEGKTQLQQGRENQTELFDWFREVPCAVFENPDGIAVFEPAISPIDTYEQLVNNTRDMTQYNDEAKLLVSGYRPSEPLTILDEKTSREISNPKRRAQDAEWLRSKVMFVDNDGEIHWLLKEVDYTGILDLQNNLLRIITMLTGVTDMTDESFGNVSSGVALGYKLYPLDQYSATTDRIFRKGYLRLWEIVTNRLNDRRKRKGQEPFDFRDIDIMMQRNIPTDKDQSISRAVMMKSSGLFSDETCINESSVEVDPKEEMERRDLEEQEDFDRIQQRNEAGTETVDETIDVIKEPA